jgi:peptidoglycan/LPS O-acetylase OafA/YrhL
MPALTEQCQSEASPSSTLGYRPPLDGLRAVAVVAVVLYHLGFHQVRGGFLGVDTFFVLSGYLITTLLVLEYRRQRGIGLGAFWLRRAKRLLPALFLLLLAVAAYAAVVASNTELSRLRNDSIASLFYVANWRFVLAKASYFELFSSASPLRHLWSLAIEEQFYLVWPIVVLVALRLGRGRLRVLTAVAGSAAVASVAIMRVLQDPRDPSRAYFGTDSRAHELLVGALLALVLVQWPRVFARGRAVAVGLGAAALMLVAFATVHDTGTAYYRGGSLVFAVLAALVIGTVTEGPPSVLSSALSLRPVRWVGQVSYGLHLWHWPAIVWLDKERVGFGGPMLVVVRVGAMLAATVASYYVVERPIRFGSRPAPRTVGILSTGFVACAVALLVTTTGGTTTASLATGAIAVPKPPAAANAGFLPNIVIVGDSIAKSMAPGIADATKGRAYVTNASFAGCGIAAGAAALPDHTLWKPSLVCRRRVPQVHSTVIQRDHPRLVIWYSEWETSDRVIGGRAEAFGTAAHDAELRADLEAAYRRLAANGARVALLLNVPRTSADKRPHSIDWTARTAHLNDLLRELAAHHPDSALVIDLNPYICPAGPPCPATVDHMVLRPDGAHYTRAASVWLATKVVPTLPLDAATTTTLPRN